MNGPIGTSIGVHAGEVHIDAEEGHDDGVKSNDAQETLNPAVESPRFFGIPAPISAPRFPFYRTNIYFYIAVRGSFFLMAKDKG